MSVAKIGASKQSRIIVAICVGGRLSRSVGAASVVSFLGVSDFWRSAYSGFSGTVKPVGKGT